MGYKFMTILLFCFSLLPSAYLRYYPFRILASRSVRRFLLCGHLIIFLLEFVLISVLYSQGVLVSRTHTYQQLYFISYLPHVLLLVFTIRPYWFRHIFVLGLQSIYMLFIHTVSMEIYKLGWPAKWEAHEMLEYFGLYLFLFLLGMPLMQRLLGWLFTRKQLRVRPAYWYYLGPVPLLLCYYLTNMDYYDLPTEAVTPVSIYVYTLLSRGILLLVAVCLVAAVRSGIRHADQLRRQKEKNVVLQDQLEQLNLYAALLQKEQQKMAILRHDSRHQLRLLAQLTEQGYFAEAEKQLKQLQKEVEEP
ncbi:hypothetical protein LQE88_10820 [Acidaminococcus sp. NSJ-142]|uniref:hypothetical protein n=1 Tax=Acidaminococcus hominis TaxID=2897706 RepID=UPI001E58A6D0|nr:hypothetical protein [Acidaminococcus hominis]MCD2436467.1 hypothetical protein [Acidaminococcus hominis]